MPARFVSRAGDLDLIVTLNYVENTGTSTAPVFVVRTGSANPLDDIVVYSTPRGGALEDFDGDGTLRRCP